MYDQLIRPIADRAVTLLADDFKLKIKSREFEITHPEQIELRSCTSMIGLGGSFSVMFVMSFDNDALESLTRSFSHAPIADNEMEEMKRSASCEIANVIIGNALENFPNRGSVVTITPPISVEHATTITKNESSKISSVTIESLRGYITVSIIGA